MASSSSSEFPPLIDKLVVLAHQISEFIQATGSSTTYARHVPNEVGYAIHYITRNYPRPDRSDADPVASVEEGRATRSASVEPPKYPYQWATDTPAFRKSVKTFITSIQHYRQIPQVVEFVDAEIQKHHSQHIEQPETEDPSSSKSTPSTNPSTVDLLKSTSETMSESNITPAVQAVLDDMMARVVKLIDEKTSNMSSPQGSQKSSTPSSTPNTSWHSSDIGYFDPLLDKAYGDGELLTVGRDTYYRNVHLFVERIKDLAMIKGSVLVRNNLNTALRGSAQSWYTAELTNLERIGLRSDINGVDAWCSALIARFKEPSGVALTKLTAEKYTVKDARNRREPSAYIQTIIRHARAANIEGVLNQLTFAHEGIAAELRVFIDPPSQTTSVSQFIRTLDLKKTAWYELHTRIYDNHSKHAQHPDQRSRPQQQYGGYKSYSPGFSQARLPQNQQQSRLFKSRFSLSSISPQARTLTSYHITKLNSHTDLLF